MRRVFLSYRRDDSQTITGFLCEKLEDPTALGPGSVFMDIDDIPDGVDFRQVIDEAVGKCEFFLAVIGRRWVTDRLKNPNDFVRLEIEAALRRNIPVTPVLVDGATMPAPADVPNSLRPLLTRQARTLRPGKDFTADVLLMVERLHTAKQWIAERTGVPVPVLPTPARKAGDRTEITLPGGVKMAFAYCPPGTFLMGSPVTEEGRNSSEQQHEVRLTREFLMGVHPVTQAQWVAVMGNNPSHFRGDRLPVEQVSWDDVQAFCALLKQQSGSELRLPTEAEWEYAARGGTTTPFYWGCELNGTQANCDGNRPYGTAAKGTSLGVTTLVGRYGREYPHPWGLTDVIGNVWEWCADWYDGSYYVKSPSDDPQGPENGSSRVIRGGGWDCYATGCRAAVRRWDTPVHRPSTIGFRLASGPSLLE